MYYVTTQWLSLQRTYRASHRYGWKRYNVVIFIEVMLVLHILRGSGGEARAAAGGGSRYCNIAVSQAVSSCDTGQSVGEFMCSSACVYILRIKNWENYANHSIYDAIT